MRTAVKAKNYVFDRIQVEHMHKNLLITRNSHAPVSTDFVIHIYR